MRALSLAAAASLAFGITAAAPQVAFAAPDGSYRDTCRDQRTDGPILTATCRGSYGWQTSSIDYRRCNGDIANWNGRLVCRGRDDGWRGRDHDDDDNGWGANNNGWNNNGWGNNGWNGDGRGDDRGDWRGDDGRGGYGRARLTLFGRTGFGGRAFGVGRDVYNLSDTGFNDQAESVRIDGGVWLLCEDRDFGGRCITLSQSTTDLWRFGMGDKVSSVRRIR